MSMILWLFLFSVADIFLDFMSFLIQVGSDSFEVGLVLAKVWLVLALLVLLESQLLLNPACSEITVFL